MKTETESVYLTYTISREPKLSIGGYTYEFEDVSEWGGWTVTLSCDGAVVNTLYAPTKREAQVKAFNWLLDLHEAKDKTMWK